jgi:DNA-binding CsgD family transcriptional regulator
MVGDISLQDFSDLVSLVYQAATNPDLWPVFLRRISSFFGAGGTALYLYDFASTASHLDASGSASLAVFTDFDPEYIASAAGYFSDKNVWTLHEAALQTGVAVTGGMLYPNRLLPRTEWYGDWLRPQGYFYAIRGIVDREGSLAVKFTSLRTRAAGEYDNSHLKLWTALVPHVRQACAIHRKLVDVFAARDGSLTLCDRLPFGIVFIDQFGRAIHANRAAQKIAQAREGLVLGRDGSLACGVADESRALMRLIEDAVATAMGRGHAAGGAMRISRHAPAKPLSAQVSPLRSDGVEPFANWVRAPVAILIVSDPDAAPSASLDALQSLYRLTPAEARLTIALVAGQQIDEYADGQGIARSTAATHLKRVLGKMGVHRQSDIVRTLVNNPVFLASPAPPRVAAD